MTGQNKDKSVELVAYKHGDVTLTRKRRTRTFGTVKILKSGKYQPIYQGPDGKRYYCTSLNNEGEARQYLEQRRAEIITHTWRSPDAISAENFAEYARVWVKQRETRQGNQLRPSTVALYERQLAGGLSYFNSYDVTGIKPVMVGAWHERRCETSGKTSAGAEARLLHAIFETAVRDGIIERNPVRPELLRSHTGAAHRAPTAKELTAILSKLPDRLRLFAYVEAFGGLRFGEAVRLERQDFEQSDDGHVTVNVTCQAQRIDGKWLIRPPKSSEGIRRVTLPEWLTPIVEDHLNRYVGVFPASKIFEPAKRETEYMSESTWSHIWRRAVKAVGITDTIRSHDLRHYFGSALADSGAGIRQLQNALGHGTARASLGYLESTHGLPSTLADRLAALPELGIPTVVQLKVKAE